MILFSLVGIQCLICGLITAISQILAKCSTLLISPASCHLKYGTSAKTGMMIEHDHECLYPFWIGDTCLTFSMSLLHILHPIHTFECIAVSTHTEPSIFLSLLPTPHNSALIPIEKPGILLVLEKEPTISLASLMFIITLLDDDKDWVLIKYLSIL